MKKIILTSFLILNSFNSFAWREVGHFSICEIAYQNLTAKTKKTVDKILGQKSFAEQCTWPDMVRKSEQWKHTYDWHFVNVEDNDDYFTPEKFGKKGDVITAILEAKAKLEDPSLTVSAKKPHLLFLGHFVGDIHQVVHIGRKSDLGGNRLFATWFGEQEFDDIEHLRAHDNHDHENELECLGPFFRNTPTGECLAIDARRSTINLHKIWDLLMVDQFIKENNIVSSHEYPYKEYVNVINQVTNSQKTYWQNSYVLQWAQESLCYRPSLYLVGDKNLAADYYKNNIATLNERMLQGGYRLAITLNRIFDPAIKNSFRHIQDQENNLLSSIENLKNGKPSAHHLSLDECSVGVLQNPSGRSKF